METLNKFLDLQNSGKNLRLMTLIGISELPEAEILEKYVIKDQGDVITHLISILRGENPDVVAGSGATFLASAPYVLLNSLLTAYKEGDNPLVLHDLYLIFKGLKEEAVVLIGEDSPLAARWGLTISDMSSRLVTLLEEEKQSLLDSLEGIEETINAITGETDPTPEEPTEDLEEPIIPEEAEGDV